MRSAIADDRKGLMAHSVALSYIGAGANVVWNCAPVLQDVLLATA
jgi:hypothetical protein